MTTRRIDTHHHAVPPAYAAWLRSHAVDAGGLPIPEWSPEASLEMMDQVGVETAVLSVSTPGVNLGDVSDARKWARRVNDDLATVVRDHPGRFGFFATLTLPDVDGSLAELAYAFDVLHADGVILLANHRGTYLGAPEFDVVFDELNRRNAVVFVHPAQLPAAPAADLPAFVADFLLDTTRAAIRLGASGTLERCPNLKIILSHAGGFVPYAAYRIASFASPRRDLTDGLALLKRFYFDIALSGSPTALPSLLALAAPDHVLFGSDFPHAPAAFVRGFSGMYAGHPLADVQRRSIDRGAAEGLFPRFKE